MKAKEFTCCICGKVCKGFGNNPDGAMWRDKETGELVEFQGSPEDRCCDECNQRYVIPGRLYKMAHKSN